MLEVYDTNMADFYASVDVDMSLQDEHWARQQDAEMSDSDQFLTEEVIMDAADQDNSEMFGEPIIGDEASIVDEEVVDLTEVLAPHDILLTENEITPVPLEAVWIAEPKTEIEIVETIHTGSISHSKDGTEPTEHPPPAGPSIEPDRPHSTQNFPDSPPSREVESLSNPQTNIGESLSENPQMENHSQSEFVQPESSLLGHLTSPSDLDIETSYKSTVQRDELHSSSVVAPAHSLDVEEAGGGEEEEEEEEEEAEDTVNAENVNGTHSAEDSESHTVDGHELQESHTATVPEWRDDQDDYSTVAPPSSIKVSLPFLGSFVYFFKFPDASAGDPNPPTQEHHDGKRVLFLNRPELFRAGMSELFAAIKTDEHFQNMIGDSELVVSCTSLGLDIREDDKHVDELSLDCLEILHSTRSEEPLEIAISLNKDRMIIKYRTLMEKLHEDDEASNYVGGSDGSSETSEVDGGDQEPQESSEDVSNLREGENDTQSPSSHAALQLPAQSEVQKHDNRDSEHVLEQDIEEGDAPQPTGRTDFPSAESRVSGSQTQITSNLVSADGVDTRSEAPGVIASRQHQRESQHFVATSSDVVEELDPLHSTYYTESHEDRYKHEPSQSDEQGSQEEEEGDEDEANPMAITNRPDDVNYRQASSSKRSFYDASKDDDDGENQNASTAITNLKAASDAKRIRTT